ncbi:MAG TPA: zinc ribbon domain-containing protein [Cytophagaceae bacterium]|jgi:putative FmdB family regulatory protein|nr:zinc ribbon domain-containing protein [Cytophagaceae bacterium]
MPTYEHICLNESCKNEWEDFYSIMADPPKVCPKCNQETAKRMVSGGSGKGVVELTGQELTDKMKQDVKDIKSRAGRDEKYLANLIGEDRAHKKLLDLQRR